MLGPSYSKQLYAWGEDQSSANAADIKDVTDRFSWMLWQTGELQNAYATVCSAFQLSLLRRLKSCIQSLEQARTGLKDIRNFEAKLQGSRDKRADTRARMIKLIDNNGEQAKIQALRSELSHLEQLDET